MRSCYARHFVNAMIKFTSLLKLSFICLSFLAPTNLVIAQSSPTQINFFRASPRLVDSNTSFRSTYVRSTYNFKIDIPANAGNNLAKIVINQQPNFETIKLYPEKTKVFLLTPDGEIPVKHSANLIVDKSKDINEITVDFLKPIPSGSKIKLALRARNPLYGGIYQFGVTVYPQGNNPRSLYLGIARFHFHQNGNF